MSDHGFKHDYWVKLALPDGGRGYVSGIYLTGNDTGGVPAEGQCGH